MEKQMANLRTRNFHWVLLLFVSGVLLNGCTLNTRLVVTNDKPYTIKVFEKYKDVDGSINILEVGDVPAKQTKDFGRVLHGVNERGKVTFELRNAQNKVVAQVTAAEDEDTHDVVNLHING